MSWISEHADTENVRDIILSELWDMNQDGGVEICSDELREVIKDEFGYPVRRIVLYVDNWVSLCIEFDDQGEPELDPDNGHNIAVIVLAKDVYGKEVSA